MQLVFFLFNGMYASFYTRTLQVLKKRRLIFFLCHKQNLEAVRVGRKLVWKFGHCQIRMGMQKNSGYALEVT